MTIQSNLIALQPQPDVFCVGLITGRTPMSDDCCTDKYVTSALRQ